MTTETEKGHNGYTDRATYNFAVVIDSDRTTHELARGFAAEVRANPEYIQMHTGPELRNEAKRVGEMLREYLEEAGESAGMYEFERNAAVASIFGAGMGAIDFEDIGRRYIDDLNEAIEYDAKKEPAQHHELCACAACVADDDLYAFNATHPTD